MKRNLLNIILVVGGVAFMCMSIYFFLSEEIGFGLIFFLFYILEIVAIGKNNQQKRKEAEQEKLAKEAAEKERLLKEQAEQELKEKLKAELARKQLQEATEKQKIEYEKTEKEIDKKERLLKEKEERERKMKEAVSGNKPKQRFCINCGKPLPSDLTASFCMYCGAKTEAKTDEKTDIKNDGKTNQVNNSKKKYEDQIVLHEGKCPVCGKDTEETDSVCTNCGFPVISIAGNITKREKDKIIEAVKEYRKNMT